VSQSTAVLQCVECHVATAWFERGWRAYLTDDEDGPAYAVILCPECSEREFGDWHEQRHS